jgi:L-ascorbate metabolism protein UlaG (beta-lactamase superfamily)
MDIFWMGHSCFRIKGKEAVLFTDPFDPGRGIALDKTSAQIVTVSHPHPGHSNAAGVVGGPRVVKGPGEYEVAGVLITGISTFHDDEQGAKRGKSTVYVIEMEGLRLCHLGDLGHGLSNQQIGEIGDVEVLMVPVGGGNTIDAAAAAQIVRTLEPRIVLPMHYRTDLLSQGLEPVDVFLQEMGVKAEPEPRLSVSKTNLPGEIRVALLSPPSIKNK